MSAVTTKASASHWLVRALARTGCAPIGDLDIGRNDPIDEVWAELARQTGLSPAEIAAHAADFLRLEAADVESSEPTASRLLPESVARKYTVYPIRHSDHDVVIAAADPLFPDLEQTLAFLCGRRVVLEVAAPKDIQRMIDTRYSPDRIVEEILGGLRDEDSGMEFVDEVDAVIGNPTVTSMPVVRLADHILKSAITQGASDIHLEPDSSGAAVRFRVDGVMREYMRVPAPVLSRVIARIKVLGRLDIADRLRPQDGRVRVSLGGRRFDLRISTVPTRDHEKSVIRVLPQDVGVTLEELGIAPPELAALRDILQERNGIVIVTGPTGSGKTTTLYGALKELATGDVNIVTVEDPVEFDLPGVTQIQVNTKQGVNFASALRAVLRQDPDVILIGEIRDAETAGIAVQAAMTGHLVLATLHANDAAHVVSRLVDLGLDYGAVAATLRGSIAQRLLRRVCPDCVREGRDPESVGAEGQRCKTCGTSGYQGRIPVAEVLVIEPDIAELVSGGAAPARLREAATRHRMRTLAEVAMEHVASGRTTVAEVERVLGVESEPTAPPSEPVAVAEPETPAKPAVLVVDDEADSRLLVGSILGKGGFAVTEAADGENALHRLDTEGPFSLVILDLVMPGLNGKETLERIRSNVRTAGLPVVVLTGSDSEEQEVELLGMGADDYMRKPVDPVRLLARIRALHRRLSL